MDLSGTSKRLQLQTVPGVAADTVALRCLDYDRDRFDIEFALTGAPGGAAGGGRPGERTTTKNSPPPRPPPPDGTTYNSYLIFGADAVALVDASHEKFRELYLPAVRAALAAAGRASIDFVVISHTEPDHSGLVPDVLDAFPGTTIIASKVALTYLGALMHRPFASRAVKTGDALDLGGGHALSFVNAPNLHWPDTMFTHDAAGGGALYTCDAFGAHYCTAAPYDTDLPSLSPHYAFYYDCLMKPNARSVTTALRKVAELEYGVIATGHGPVLRHHVATLVDRYAAWSAKAGAATTTVVVLHAGEYGHSERLHQALARGVVKAGVATELFDAATADPQELAAAVGRAAGVVLMAPPSSCADCAASVATLVSAVKRGARVLVAESYGGDDEPVDVLVSTLVDAGAPPVLDALRVKDAPGDADYVRFEQAGTDLAQALTCKEAAARVKAAMSNDVAKALARVSGGLYVVTAARGGGGASGAMVASWVAQASFEPLALTVAVAKDRAIETLMQVGDPFVLNCLSDTDAPAAMKHFLQRFPPGADRFAGVPTSPSPCGAPVLAAAVAHCECVVASRLDAGDHHVVVARVVGGGVADPAALTAVHRRKVATYY